MNRSEQNKILSQCYCDTPNKELSQRLGISVGMVMRYAYQMGLKKDPKYLSDVNRKCGSQSSIATRYWKCNK